MVELARRHPAIVPGVTAQARHSRRIVGIAGKPGAGKTTYALGLVAASEVPAAYVPMDGFHLADVQLDRLGRRDRKGAPDTFDVEGYAATLRRILGEPESTVYVPGFERELEQPVAGAIAVPPDARLVLTEGNYLLLADGAWPAVRAHLAEVWYVDLAADERVRRLVERHEASGKTTSAARAWVERVDEANVPLVEATRERADLVLAAP